VSNGGSQQSAYSYDALGNPTQRIDVAGTAAFTWDNANRLKTATDPVTGRTLTYGYDTASRLTTITATSGQASTQIFDYDSMDRLTSHTLRNGSGTQLAKIDYVWDGDDNLTTKTTTGTAGAGTNTYGYDHAGRLTSWTAPGGTTTAYEWDASGNRTKAGSNTFTYDERNRLTSGDGSDYTYTPRGTLASQTKNGTITSYTFDAFDRLIADGESLYSYDALDRVTSRIRGTTNQTFTYSGLGNDLAAISASGSVQARYSRDAFGALLGLQEGGAAAVAALSDLHGDLVATFTTSLVTSTSYDPFGAVTAQVGATTTLGYQGEYTDPDTGKVNMHARWYQPGTGTFTSRDTATLAPNPSVQANRYTYANASPLTGIDPSGHFTIPAGMGTSGSSGYSGAWCPSGYLCLGAGGGAALPAAPRAPGPGWSDVAKGVGGMGCVTVGNVCSQTYIDSLWWTAFITSPGYDYYHSPLKSDEEAKRTGTMPNGRPVDQPNFWFASEQVRNDYMAGWWPATDDRYLAVHWVSVGGLESWQDYSATASRPPAVGGRSSDPPFRYRRVYDDLAKHGKAIAEAAKEHGVDKRALAAVLLYEGLFVETRLAKVGAGEYSYWREQGKASLGISQLEVYKAKDLLRTYYQGRKIKGVFAHKMSNDQIANLLIYDDGWSIKLTAARMRQLKETYRVPTSFGPGGVKGSRPINDWEAAVAYCGCVGNAAEFSRWAASGYTRGGLENIKRDKYGRLSDTDKLNIRSSMDRYKFMHGVGRTIVDEYFRRYG
jgi:RHS repeat-associated protein